MKKIIYFLVVFTVLTACIDEVALPVKVIFETEIVDQDQTVPVQVKITNGTEGADTYNWKFEGGIPNTSNSKNPGIITYEQAGDYTIILEASNRDGSEDRKEIQITIKPEVVIGFNTTIIDNNFTPVEIKLENTTVGATNYEWTFEGGTPASSTEQNPPNIIFSTPGKHKITLKVTNGTEEYTKEETIEVAPYLKTDFEYTTSFEDDDFQVPVKLMLANKSMSATNYEWTFEGANITASTDKNPEIIFTIPGTYKIELKSSNSKDDKTITKTVTVYENTNLRVLENIKLGINTAHKNNTIGAYFSTITREVYTQNQVTDEIGKKIDLVFFGLNDGFIFNKFISPDDVDSVSFTAIPNGTKTRLVNRLEDCNCTTMLSTSQFDMMNDDTVLKSITVDETNDGLKEFDNAVVPRIIVFETADKRKGAIKIKEFKEDGLDSFISIDIKVQKEAK